MIIDNSLNFVIKWMCRIWDKQGGVGVERFSKRDV